MQHTASLMPKWWFDSCFTKAYFTSEQILLSLSTNEISGQNFEVRTVKSLKKSAWKRNMSCLLNTSDYIRLTHYLIFRHHAKSWIWGAAKHFSQVFYFFLQNFVEVRIWHPRIFAWHWFPWFLFMNHKYF